jgi:hypothetical protein
MDQDKVRSAAFCVQLHYIFPVASPCKAEED